MEYTEAMLNRLRRVEGQVRGVVSMMEKTKDCKEVVTQLSAIRSAIDKVIATIVVENLQLCIRQDIENTSDAHEAVKKAMELLLKSR